MNYVDHFNLFGIDAKQIPCDTGEGAPTTATVGAVGCFYMDTLTGDVYKCVSAADGVYGWESTQTGSAHNTQKVENTSIGKKCAQFSYLMCGTDKVESFIFFTDPHLAGLDPHEDEMHNYLSTLKTYYDATPTSFVVCGGDWLEDEQTQKEACFKLAYVDSWMRANFDHYYPVVGNHDDNSYGVDSTGVKYTGTISKETVRNLMLRREGNLYYSFDGVNTKGYVLDSCGEEENDLQMTDYRWEQIAWLAERLKEDDAENSAIFLHAGFTRTGPEAHERVLSYITNNITLLCNAYNNGLTVTLNGETYDFAGCDGCVRFILSGHMHNADGVEVHNGIPVISTYDMRMNGVETFDLCLADYDKNILHMVRVGSGSDRDVMMGSRNASGNVFTVTMNLDNATVSNMSVLVNEHSTYTNTLTMKLGYNLDSITITMAGVDITDTAYDSGEIVIEDVTGDIIITNTSLKQYNNLADPASEDWSNDAYFNGSEVLDGSWYNEGYAIATNFIPVVKGDILRFKGFDREALLNGYGPVLIYYDENKNYAAQQSLRTNEAGLSSGLPTNVVEDENGVTEHVIIIRGDTNSQFVYNDVCERVRYVRICALRTVPEEEIIITINEEIYRPEQTTYTNLVPTSLDEDGVSVYNEPYGYMNGYVLSGSGGAVANANSVNCVTTGYIPLPSGFTPIYIKGSNWDNTQGYCRFYIYKTPGGTVSNAQAGTDADILCSVQQIADKYYMIVPVDTWVENYYYRITLWGNIDESNGDALVITHNEPID